ncbi:SDR family oxidoreductase [Conyzicola nivalis]|uniref:Short-chain dehydrogenase n=1 Tax=Conyzicola nivalis TaxID=1477021 RepID=A0A916SCW3_9MICO|nr:short-chain dehydrogenase [Conyzicola nivalis]
MVLGGSSGIGFAVAELARDEGANVVLTARDPGRLRAAAERIGAVGSAAFDVSAHGELVAFFDQIGAVDHVFVAAGGPYYAPLADIDLDAATQSVAGAVGTMLDLARIVPPKLGRGGSLTFMSGTGPRRPAPGASVIAAMAAATTAAAANLALEIAPARINLIAAGFVDTELSARLLGDALQDRRQELRSTLPIGRVVEPGDVAALAVHLMVNTAITGAVFDIDGGQKLLP